MHLIRLLQLMRWNICQDNPHDIPSSGQIYPAETEYSPHSLQPLLRMPKLPKKAYVEEFFLRKSSPVQYGKVKLHRLQCVPRASNDAVLFVPPYYNASNPTPTRLRFGGNGHDRMAKNTIIWFTFFVILN